MTLNGLDILYSCGFSGLRGKRIGLVTHQAALSHARRTPAFELFAKHTNLVALFGPEHGFTGEAQDLIPVPGSSMSIPVHSLYGDSYESLKPTPEMLRGLDMLVIDLVDVGSRYYTFQATMLFCLEACAAVGLPVMVVDRPNPINGVDVEGPALRPGFESFVGIHPIAIRHGLTMGELAMLYAQERVTKVKLQVMKCMSYDREKTSDWLLPPSPNMPTQRTAMVYPGGCLIEGTNLSEGRGTTRPFEYVGFPGVNPTQLMDRLRTMPVPGVEFLPVTFRPTFQKHANQSCGGVFILPQGIEFLPVRTGLALLIAFRELLGKQFQWRTEKYEFVDTIPAIDLLFGSERERTMIEAGATWRDIAKLWEPEEEEFRERRKKYLMYEEQ
jgi:uncharacterized protein YbbC (DUF1343 family)